MSTTVSDEHTVFVNEKIDTKDFRDFCHDRTVMELDCDEQFMHFENNLFGHFWYHVYPGGENLRNILKDKINRVMRYNQKFYYYADVVKQQLGEYNSIHVRRNDFLEARKDDIACMNAPEKIVEM